MPDEEFSPLTQTILELMMRPKEQRKEMFKRTFAELTGAFMELGGRHIREAGRREPEPEEITVEVVERKEV